MAYVTLVLRDFVRARNTPVEVADENIYLAARSGDILQQCLLSSGRRPRPDNRRGGGQLVRARIRYVGRVTLHGRHSRLCRGRPMAKGEEDGRPGEEPQPY